MIHNPYAKKRPRPPGWTSSSSSSSSSNVPTLAPVERQLDPYSTQDVSHKSFDVKERQRDSHFCQRHEGAHKFKENATHQNRFHNKMEPSEHMANGNPKEQSIEKATAIKTAITSNQSHKTQPNPYAETNALVNRTFASTINSHSRKNVYNPYARKKSSEPRASAHIPETSIPQENVHPPQSNVNSHSGARESIGMDGRSAHEMQTRNVSVPSNSNPPRTEHYGPRSQVSGKGSSTATSKTVSSKATAKLPSSMASIRPASWKSTSDQKVYNSLVNSSPSNSMIVKQKLGTQPLKTATVKYSSQPQLGKTEDETDRLPPELSYTQNEVKPIQDEYRMLLIKNAKVSSPLNNGWTLFPHQKKAIIRALTMRRMILALDMGLGKTLIGSVWSKAFKDTFGHDKLKVFVVCPVSLKEEWQRTAEKSVGLVVDGEGKGKGKGKSKAKRKKSTEKESAQKTNMKMSICSWAKVPKVVEAGVEHFVVCCDEAHAMQSAQAQRTKDILSLVNDKR